MWWFAVPVIVATVAAIASSNDDTKQDAVSEKTSNDLKKKEFLDELKRYQVRQQKHLEQKYTFCQGCILYPSNFYATIDLSKLYFLNKKRIDEIEKEIIEIDQLLIQIQSLEQQYDK
jgi:hypothetical protein